MKPELTIIMGTDVCVGVWVCVFALGMSDVGAAGEAELLCHSPWKSTTASSLLTPEEALYTCFLRCKKL